MGLKLNHVNKGGHRSPADQKSCWKILVYPRIFRPEFYWVIQTTPILLITLCLLMLIREVINLQHLNITRGQRPNVGFATRNVSHMLSLICNYIFFSDGWGGRHIFLSAVSIQSFTSWTKLACTAKYNKYQPSDLTNRQWGVLKNAGLTFDLITWHRRNASLGIDKTLVFGK